MNLQISTDVSPCSSAVLLQNKLPILRSVSICADTVADDVYFTVSYNPAVLPEARYEIGKLVKGKTVKTECSCGVYTEQNLLPDNKEGTVQLTLNIYAKNGLIHSQSNTCRWMPDNTWFGSEQSPQALAALIMPNEEVVHELLRKAGDILKSKGLNAEWRGVRRGKQRRHQQNARHLEYSGGHEDDAYPPAEQLAEYHTTRAFPPAIVAG